MPTASPENVCKTRESTATARFCDHNGVGIDGNASDGGGGTRAVEDVEVTTFPDGADFVFGFDWEGLGDCFDTIMGDDVSV